VDVARVVRPGMDAGQTPQGPLSGPEDSIATAGCRAIDKDSLSTPEVVERAQAGSMECFIELVDRFERRLFNFLLRRVGSTHDAEELTQETFVKAWQHLDRYQPRWQFSTWLFTIGGRAAISHLRRTQRRSEAPLAADPPASSAAGAGDPAGRVVEREECRRLWDLADEVLSETQRSALWLRYAEELPVSEIARILAKTPVGIRVILFRARQALAAHATSARPRAKPDRLCVGKAVVGELS
jgi:RNA polymerase sigma-70 factor (ECF subfamily)